jgi:DNA-binding MarR family transcriptional regulator
MMHSLRTDRIPNGSVLPLRLHALLCDGASHVSLDWFPTSLYHSPMNKIDAHPRNEAIDSTPAEGGATLFGFLDVAEQLYERIAEALSRIGLSYAKYEVLRQLRDANGSLTLGSIAEAQRCARSNITQLMDRLESEGLVRRVDCPADRRSVRAELTPLGLAQAEAGIAQIDSVRAAFVASLTGPERAELGRLLAKLR